MKDFIQVADQYYVLATSILADHETRVLKQGETFAVLDAYGDIQPLTHSESGIFHRGTRHLSRLEFKIFHDQRPLLLNSTLRDDNGLLKVDMTNRDLQLTYENGPTYFLQKGKLYIQREKFLLNCRCQERVEISNFGSVDITLEMAFQFAADFADIFEVRGTSRAQRGRLMAPFRQGSQVIASYEGLDGVRRHTAMTLSVSEFDFAGNMIRFRMPVPAGGTVDFDLTTSFWQEDVKSHEEKCDYQHGLLQISADHQNGKKAYCGLHTSNDQFDNWTRRSTDDLIMMTTQTEEGVLYPYAGIPWFCTPFGRDGIITALQCLWANPTMAKGVLEYLSQTQAREKVAERDSTPGKIIHEVRQGEMANLKEIPFGLYYGSVDSTPLYLCLAGEYLTRTNDQDFVQKHWPSFERAIFWMHRYGDLDGDGFIEYQRENPNGLVQQGWKDSHDSVFHADGSDAQGPIALAEVQGYAYKADLEGAKLAEVAGHKELANELRKRAHLLQEKFDKEFWLDDLQTYALALDGEKRPCRVKSSNAGQCLFTEIVKRERAEGLVRTLMAPDSFSGWGIRTIAKSQARYNPMSYHNGSVWPHDVALIALGMAKYGFKDEVEKLFTGLFRAATYMELLRMPEVFCGFAKKEGEAPTLYPHACSPQAWASGSLYMMVQALLGLRINAVEKKVSFAYPRLPSAIETMKLRGLKIGEGPLDLVVQSYYGDVSVQLTRRDPGVTVLIEK